MSALSEALGQGHELTCRGKTYRISLITQDVKLAFERRMFARAKEIAKQMRDLMAQEEYGNYLHKLADDYQAGGYALESPRGVEFIKTLPGMTLLVSLLAGIDEHEALLLLKDGKDEVAALLKLILKESYHTTDEDIAVAEAEAGEKKRSLTPREVVNARIATLLDHFKLTPAQIGGLTDRQIETLYFHERDEHGAIKEPAAAQQERSLKSDLMAIDILAARGMVKRDKVEGLKEKVRDKWRNKIQQP